MKETLEEFDALMLKCKKAQDKAFILGLTIGIVTTLTICLLFQQT